MLGRRANLLLRASTAAQPLRIPLPRLQIAACARCSSGGPVAAAADDRDAYQVLGIGSRAREDEIRSAYKTLAKQWHPDRYQGAKAVAAEKRFQEIAEAFQVLSDPAERKVYDTELAAAKDAEARRKAAQRFRANSWNSEVVNVQLRVRSAKREEPGSATGMVAAACLFVTVNFVLVFRFLAG